VLECGAERTGAHLAAEFVGSRDAGVDRTLWPADPRISLRIHLSDRSLSFRATVKNSSDTPLPFGLGYHPYFAVSPRDRVESPARERWELRDGLPTGKVLPLDGLFDLQSARAVEGLTLDDVYTDFPQTPPDADGLVERGRVRFEDGRTLSVRTAPEFRELVLFIPPHRHAICLEPYTCPTDAVNLASHGLDVGWRVLSRANRGRRRSRFASNRDA
jgi:aldose 1-epimerase